MSFKRRYVWLLLALLQAPAASGRASASRPIVAVFNIQDRGSGLSSQLLERLSDYLTMGLASTGAYQVVPRDQLKQRLTTQKTASFKQCYAQSCQIEIGKELAAQKSLATTIMKLGSICSVTAVLFDLRKATSEGGATAEGKCTEEEVLKSIKAVVSKLAAYGKPRRDVPRGGLLIKSLPAGAGVWLDGKQQSGLTPLTLKALEVGEHNLELRKGDYRLAGRVTVTKGKYRTYNLTLQKARGQIQVTSEPPEASIYLNGIRAGKTPHVISNVVVGQHRLELRKRGYATVTKKLTMSTDNLNQSVKLTMEPGGYLFVSSRPTGGRVTLDGEPLGRTPVERLVSVGQHTVRIELQGREGVERQVETTAGERTNVIVPLELTAAEKQRLARAAEQRQQQEQQRQAQLTLQKQQAEPVLRQRRRDTIWAWSCTGGGVALMAAAGVLYGLGASKGSAAHDSYLEASAQTDFNQDDIDTYRKEIKVARTQLIIGHALLGVGLAAAGYGIYKFITRPAEPVVGAGVLDGATVSLSPAPSGASLSIGGQW